MSKLITLGSLIDKTVEHYHHHFKELVGITLWLIIGATPFLLSGYIAPVGVDAATPPNEAWAYLGVNFLGLITTMISSLWIAGCLFYTIDARAKGQTPDHVVLGKRSWRAIPGLALLSIIVAAIAIAGVVALVLPGFLVTMLNHADGTAGALLGVLGVLLVFAGILGALYGVIRVGIEVSFAQPIFLLEGTQGKFSLPAIWKSFISSRSLVKGSWWAVAIRIFVPNAIISLIAVAITTGVNLTTTVLVSVAAASLSALAIKLIAVGLTLSVFVMNALVMPLYSLSMYYLYDSVKR
jgi:hypothetical protein